jgi:hypothetical protein
VIGASPFGRTRDSYLKAGGGGPADTESAQATVNGARKTSPAQTVGIVLSSLISGIPSRELEFNASADQI